MDAKQIEKLSHIERAQLFYDLVEKHLDSTARAILTLDSFGTWNCLLVSTNSLDLSVAKLDSFCDLLKSFGFDVDVMFKVIEGDARTLHLQFNIIS